MDYSKPQEVRSFFEGLDFDVMFHTAANATTADCENDPAGTHLVNCDSAIEIAKVCEERGKRMLFISTSSCSTAKSEPGRSTRAWSPVASPTTASRSPR